jgi:hypothetical protein
VCAVLVHIREEVKSQGTALGQMLIDGPTTDFNAPDTCAHIRDLTRDILGEVKMTRPETDRQAFVNGAYKVLQTFVQEASERGSIMGKRLLFGAMGDAEHMAAKKAMVHAFREVSDLYSSPPRVDDLMVMTVDGYARSTQAAQAQARAQQTPSRAPHGPAAHMSQASVANTSTVVGGVHYPAQSVVAGADEGHAAASSWSTQAYPPPPPAQDNHSATQGTG